MARKRVVTARREMLARDVNDISDFLIYDLQTTIRDVMGTSSGVVIGLEVTSYAGLNLTVPSGIITDNNGTFYELISGTTVTLPSANNTYYVYCDTSSTTDTPISGYVLIDTATRLENYNTVNSRTYDSISVTYTSGAIPSGKVAICSAVVSGGSITSVVDLRQYVSVGNMIAYNLQYLIDSNKNVGLTANKLTGYVYDDSDASHHNFIKVNVDNAHAGYPIYIDNGSNAGTIGFTSIVSGNIGYLADLTIAQSRGYKANISSTTTGFVADGSSKTATVGYWAEGLDKGVSIINSNTGIEIVNSNIALSVINNTQDALDKSIYIETSGNVVTNFGIAQTIKDSGVGHAIVWENGGASSDFIGLFISNNSTQVGGTAINIGNSSDKFSTGIYIEDCENGINIINTAGDNIDIDISKNNGSNSLVNNAISISIKHNTGGIVFVQDSSSSSSDSVAIFGASGGSYKFSNFINATDYTTGIRLDGDLSGGEIGIDLLNNALGIKIVKDTTHNANPSISIDNGGNSSSYSDGIHIADSYRGIKIYNTNRGVETSDVTTAIKIDNSTTGVEIQNSTTAIAIYSNNEHQIQIAPLGANPSSPSAGEVAMVDTGSAIKLRVYNSYTLSWEDCN